MASDDNCWTTDKCGIADIRKLELFTTEPKDGHLAHEHDEETGDHDHEETSTDSTAGLVAGMSLLVLFV